MNVPRCLTIATSDSGGGAGIQADLKAFAAVHELPPDFIRVAAVPLAGTLDDLSFGEDFELLATLPSNTLLLGEFAVIGRCEEGDGISPPELGGYEHFSATGG